jgi:hypothetical protein
MSVGLTLTLLLTIFKRKYTPYDNVSQDYLADLRKEAHLLSDVYRFFFHFDVLICLWSRQHNSDQWVPVCYYCRVCCIY